MKRLFGLALALLATTAALGRADSVDFSYTFTANPLTVPSGTGSVSITPYPGGTATLDFDTPYFVPAISFTSSTSALGTDSSPADVFNSTFTVMVGVTDTASGQSHTFTFNGVIEGTLTQTQSTLTATFTGPLTQTENLGGNQYTVSIDPNPVAIPAPQMPIGLASLMPCYPKPEVDLTGGALEALLSAQFLVTPLMQPISYPGDPQDPNPLPGNPEVIRDVPEPSSILLGLLAGPAAWLLRRRMRSA
jgi:hypothetical protein